ncbi:MAG: glycosyltransferase family protein [Rhodospirillales bacterium]|nr:glycosyltransferase family protein [Rhodospirillales bacterium]MDE2575678.1 glycosyltransferase family protein [Rhodospirillales bacterium]
MSVTTPDAIGALRGSLATRPDDAAILLALGTALWHAGARDESVLHLLRASQIAPLNVDAQNNLGNALTGLGRHTEAIGAYRAALALAPGLAELHYNLGNVLHATGDAAAAQACFRRALQLKPGHAGAHNNLGNALRAEGRHAEALACYERAHALQPGYAGTLNNAASALLALHRPQEALVHLYRAHTIAPDDPEICNNLGGALLALDQPQSAASWFGRAIARDPNLVQARFGEGLALLAQGDCARGWPAYESRWQDARFTADEIPVDAPAWDGATPLAGLRLLLHAEQGLGDTIQFARYAALARQRGAHVILQVQAPLVGLLGGMADEIVAAETAHPACDVHAPLLSLPYLFQTRLATIPAPSPYLHADAPRVAKWQARLGPKRRRRIGIAWSGSADHPDDAIRSIPPARMVDRLGALDAELHLIQKEIAADAPRDGVIRHDHLLTDFQETAALLACLDHIITVDTSVAHLAGAMARPCAVLLQHASDFRWLRDRADSPWYPGMRLFRQATPGTWDDVLGAVVRALAG